jgi:hypothetical protein
MNFQQHADLEHFMADMRVTKSRFATSTCASCGRAIQPGDQISRSSSATKRGGWSHADCILQQRKKEQGEAKQGGESKRRRASKTEA